MSRTKIALSALIVAVAVGALWWSGLTFDAIAERVACLRGMGAWGLVVFVALYAACTWLMVPASWLQGAAGFLYGPLAGIALSWVASTGFGAVSFLIARGRLRKPIAARIGHGRLAALDDAMAERGTPVVALIRLSPISPYNVLNYALGATPVTPRSYLVGSALGGLVPCVVWALVGASLSDLAAVADAAAAPTWTRYAVIGFTLAASAGIARFVNTALDRQATDARPTHARDVLSTS